MTTASLNPEQTIAAHHIEGPLLVLAGAGSGKTRIVTHRIAHLLQLGVPASEIVALTFTNKAAEEMRSRVYRLTNQAVLTSTFHSLGARILRENTPSFTIYDDDDSRSLLKSCLKILGLKDDKAAVKSTRAAISEAKNALLQPSQVDDIELREIYAFYQQKLAEYGAFDFDDLLFRTVSLLQENTNLLSHYQSRWRFLLIDEYQDTNEAQYTLAKLLTATHKNLFVVGDPDQSIYSWRGANIHNILNFERDFPGAKIVKLEQNYRSTEHILQAANCLISHNAERYEKNLWSDLGEGNKVELHTFENEKEEAHFVAKTLFSHHTTDNIPLKEMVIFYRTNAQSRIFEDALLRHQIPYVIVGGLSFYARREIKDILAFLRVAISPADFLSFARTINLPKRGFGKKALQTLHDLAAERQEPIFTLCETADIKLSAKQREGLREYVAIIRAAREMRNQKTSLRDLIRETIERSRYLDYLAEDEETLDDRKANLEELVSKAAEWEAQSETPTLDAFLEELTLRSSLDEAGHHPDTVKLMTLHNGKGLEFPVAFVVGLEEDLLPHINAKESPEALEEERRLLYVGMTRAKKFLYLTASSYRLIWGTPRLMEPSRFLDELPPEHLSRATSPTATPSGFAPGTYVTHRDFGRGIVQKAYETSLGLTYDVYFPECNETRSLVAKYAKLTP